MLAYAVRRIIVSVPVLFASTFVVFVLVSLSGNPVDRLRERNPPPPAAVLAAEEHRLHLDQPLAQRYWTWLSGLFRGDFGPSVQSNIDIGAELGARLQVTLRLIFAAMLLALVLAVVTGAVSAVRQYSRLDYSVTFLGFVFLAMPSFWIAVLLKEAGVKLNQTAGTQVVYTIGERTIAFQGGLLASLNDIVAHMILPTIVLSLISFASWSRYQRASMLEVLGSDYVRLARAKGLRWRTVLRRHALRTALIPLVTITALDLAQIIGGAVITETVFQWHGMGEFLLRSITLRDVYAVEGWLLASATVVIIFNLIADLLYGVLDPRIRHD